MLLKQNKKEKKGDLWCNIYIFSILFVCILKHTEKIEIVNIIYTFYYKFIGYS